MVSEPLDRIELLLLDVDGVLTEGTVTYNDDGIEYKQFNVRDGLGIRMLMHFGIPVGIVTGRRSKALLHRCENLGIELVFDGIRNKADVLDSIVSRTGSPPETIAFMGDDLVDLPLMRRIGVPIAVSDAHPAVCAAATLITTARGGNGAVREICEAILKAKALWDKVLQSFE
jgi:3-deoxy-D-manno-octulosonate 8-phosphate phosphatase (KDO 8-P phosphatase)